MLREKISGLYITGIVYKYTSPSGKVYIGQTTNEAHRRRTWFCTKRRYAGSSINRARAKYGPENFKYEVLFKDSFQSFEEALPVLDEKEKFYIKYYDSLKHGYNNTTGGLFPEYGIQTQLNGRVINNDKQLNTVRHKNIPTPKHTREEIQSLRKETNRKNGRWQKIFQFDLSGKFIREFASAGEAEEFGFGNQCNIKRACKTLGKYKGYNWRFAEDGFIMKIKPPKPKKPKKECYKDHSYNYKKVIKYDRFGNQLCEYNSIKDAMADNGIKYCSVISDCLSGRKHTAGGFVWKYKNV